MNRAESLFHASLTAAALLAGVARPAVSDTGSPAATVSQEIEVRLAEIEVVVTDRQGDAVAGLSSEDFEVLQDGRPVELTHFRAISPNRIGLLDETTVSHGGEAAILGAAPEVDSAADAAATGTEPLNLVVYVDRGYLQLGDLNQIREALKGFLRTALGPGDRAMLVSAASSLELAQGLTTVPELVIAQLDELREQPGGGRFAREYQSILQDLKRTKNEGNDLDARNARLHARSHITRIQAFAAETSGEIRQTAAQLRQLIQLIAGLPGRRAVLYVGGRVPAIHSRRLFDAWEEAFGRGSNLDIPDAPGSGQAEGGGGAIPDSVQADDIIFDSMSAAGASFEIDATRAVQEVAKMASAHGVVFHTFDASGLRGSASALSISSDAALGTRGSVPRASPTLTPGSAADSLGSLRALALGTGGRAFSSSRNFQPALARLHSDLKTYYSLGFEPLPATEIHSKIEVRLRHGPEGRSKLKVRHRPLLRLKDNDTVAAERTISALLLEEMDNPLQVEVTAGEPVAVGKDGWRVPVSITLPLSRLALVADGRVHAGRLSIFATSGGLDSIAAVQKAIVPVRIANQDLLTSLGRRVAYELELTLPSGPERIAVTVRDDFRPVSSTAVALPGVGGMTTDGPDRTADSRRE